MQTEEDFLDHGKVRIRDVMGDDLTVVNAARVSFDTRSTWMSWEVEPGVAEYPIQDYSKAQRKTLNKKDAKLINFLAEGGHWSPFAHPQISLELYLPGMVLDQLVKHRIGMVYSDEESFVAYENAADNQMSMRYKEPLHFYVPAEDAWRPAPENKKQGSGEGSVDFGRIVQHPSIILQNRIDTAVDDYKRALGYGVAPEQARLFLPYYAMYTRRYWTSSLMGIIRFLQLREKPDAQFEIRELAGAIHRLIEPRFPHSFRAYGIGATDEPRAG